MPHKRISCKKQLCNYSTWAELEFICLILEVDTIRVSELRAVYGDESRC